MNRNIKIGVVSGIALLLIACGSGTSVPKNKKPIDFKTPPAKVSVSPSRTPQAVTTTTKPATVRTTTKPATRTTRPRR